jgi:hypothetical protein
VLGLDGYVTAAARRMACWAGVRDSFARAERTLAELAGWELSDEAIRRLCHATAAQAGGRRGQRATAQLFAAAKGDREVQIDAGKVNTPGGWRDVKVAVFARRERGGPTTAMAWDERELRPPAVRAVVAAVEDAAAFGDRCAAEARRLDWTDPKAVTVLGDGADWIWNLAAEHFPGHQGLLDLWHGAEHLADAAKAVFGADSPQARSQGLAGRQRLLEDGYGGVQEWVGAVAGLDVVSKPKRRHERPPCGVAVPAAGGGRR